MRVNKSFTLHCESFLVRRANFSLMFSDTFENRYLQFNFSMNFLGAAVALSYTPTGLPSTTAVTGPMTGQSAAATATLDAVDGKSFGALIFSTPGPPYAHPRGHAAMSLP